MAKKTSVKNKSTLAGTNAADVLTVKHTQVTVNAGKGNDKINVNSGSSHKIYGEAGNDTIIVAAKAGSGSKIYGDDAKNKLTGKDTFTINGGKKNYFYGGKGVDTFNVNGGTTNYIYGGVGNDVIVIGKTSTGTAIVKDFSAKSGNKDTVKVTGGAVKSIAVSGTNMVVKGGKSASVTLQNAKSKTFTVTDTLGTYTVAGANVKLALGKNYKGTLNTASFITTVDARSDANAFTINGNAKNNTIYGGAGNNILNGGAGNDTLSGGAGKDKLVYANGQGKDTISDYTAGQDTLQLSSGSISKAALANSNKDLVFTVGSGSITLKNAAAKSISLKDSRGNYTASNTAITLASNFTGTMDATKYLASVKTIDGQNAAKAVNITGNAQNNTIYAGKAGGTINGGAGNDTLYGGAGKDTLTGGTGNDTFVYVNGQGNDTITDYIEGQDTLQISSGSISEATLANSNKDVVFTVGTGSITLQNAATKTISLKDSNGSYTASDVAITLGSDFVGTMDATKYLYSVKIIDGRNVTETINITGNNQDNTIYAGKAGGTLNGGAGNDMLYGGAGKDYFQHYAGNDTVFNYDYDSDVIESYNYKYSGFDVNGNDFILYFANDTSVTVKNVETGIKYYCLSDGINGEEYKTFDTKIFIGSENGAFLEGTDGNDILIGGSGNDELHGGQGDDYLYGGDGSDSFIYSGGNDIVKDLTLEDKLIVEGKEVTGLEVDTEGAKVFTVNDGSVTVYNTDLGRIQVEDSRGNFVIENNGIKLMSDFMSNSTNKRLEAGVFSTIETIDAKLVSGHLTIIGNSLNNTIYGGLGYNLLYGEDGNDIIYGGENGGTVWAGKGNDTIYCGSKSTSVYDGEGDDVIYGGNGNDTIYFGDGNNTFVYSVGGGNDIVNSYKENQDVLSIVGGSITNTVFNKSGIGITFSVGDGSILLQSPTNTNVKIHDGNGWFTINNILDLDSIAVGDTLAGEVLLSEDYAGTINADNYSVKKIDGRNALKLVNINGGAQNNIIYAGKAGGTYYGGGGNNTLYGGIGNDTFVFDLSSTGSNKIYNFNSGSDILKLSDISINNCSVDANSNLKLIFSNSGSVSISDAAGRNIQYLDANQKQCNLSIGTSADDYLNGGEGIDIINGGAGDDVICGDTGDDKLYGGTGNDEFDYSAGDGNDIIYDFENGDRIFILGKVSQSALLNEKDIVLTVANGSITINDAVGKAINVRDSEGKHVYSYGSSDDVCFYGGEGADYLYGGAGNDRLYSYADDPLTLIDFGNDRLYGGSGNDKLYAGSGNNYLDGGDDDDELYGGDEDDELYGGSGNDFLKGNFGNDRYVGGTGNDIFCFDLNCGSGGTGKNIIYDYEVGKDIIRFEDRLAWQSYSVSGSDVTLNLTNGAQISIIGCTGQKITIESIDGDIIDTQEQIFT